MNLRGMHLHLDCASGAAGDMTLGALIDLGVPLDAVGAALDAIGAGRQRLKIERVVKHGITAVDIKVDTTGEIPGMAAHAHDDEGMDFNDKTQTLDKKHLEELVEKTVEPTAHPHARPRMHIHTHGNTKTHAHAHDEHRADHPHYHYSEIRKRIDDAALTDGTKRRALDIFDRIARAEAKLHGKTVDEVSFHEVGAIDSVVDVVATAAALDYLSPASVTCASVAMGHGTITCSHGVLPVPAPAALEVLREAGGVMADGGVARELCTPTGAAILAHAVTRWTAAPTGKPIATGWGAGDVDLADRANVLRITALELAAAPADAVWQLEANLDDMSPELCAPAADAIFAAGALDVWWSAITMKKGRPALTLSVLVQDDKRTEVVTAILRETTTIGVRFARVERTVLARRTVEVSTRYGTIPVKVASDGDTVMNAAPEYDACAAAAKQHGVPVKLVFAAALAAFDRA